MKISTKGRYGLRTLVDLAIHEGEEPVTLASIAQRQGISMGYLEQVFALLKKEKLVKSIKGTKGGYKLSCEPEEVTLGMILTKLEGELTIVEELESEETAFAKCAREVMWGVIEEQIIALTDTITLADMIKEYYHLQTGCSFLFSDFL